MSCSILSSSFSEGQEENRMRKNNSLFCFPRIIKCTVVGNLLLWCLLHTTVGFGIMPPQVTFQILSYFMGKLATLSFSILIKINDNTKYSLLIDIQQE